MRWAWKLTTKLYLPLPAVVGKAVVWGGRDNSVCGLSFGCSYGRTIAVQLGKYWDVAKRHRQKWWRKQKSLLKINLPLFVVAGMRWCGGSDQLQHVGWVSDISMMGWCLQCTWKNKVEGTMARYFMVRCCTVDGMVPETCILSNIFGFFFAPSMAQNCYGGVREGDRLHSHQPKSVWEGYKNVRLEYRWHSK